MTDSHGVKHDVTYDVKTVLVRITGRVQGVFFRAWTEQEAKQRRLSGWVRNRRDGSVEALFSGPADDVDAMVRACHAGPPHATVNNVESEASEAPALAGFAQRGTV